MSETHFSASEAALYLRRELDPALSEQIEAHATVCPACAAQLQDEAVLEIQLAQVASEAPRHAPISHRAWRRWAVVGAGVLAIAASLILFFSVRVQPAPAPGGYAMQKDELQHVDRVLSCLSTSDPRACEHARANESQAPARVEREANPEPGN